MRLLLTYATAVLVLAIFLTACNATDSTLNSHAQKPVNTPTPQPDGARRVTTQELETLIKEGKAFVVDVRTQDAYDAGHIPGARLIPDGEVSNRVNELPRNKTIVTYCS